ncbi:vitamin K-dependent protein Z isoform X1 [Anolis carolinensis]|uniref:Protein Z, vitamin K dependent plasma glycoprotein n=1 Tax=Anolis carolinensis TaxID=28377 RepID=G1K8D2_ANOCA|nr:PREDICTED: vitamin K-dependent protein Z isoform X1 [Anolis carolinensis]|eukprot:XP_003218778.1 PREDICTED: vitamin K-dependent protein Z isoform X1 [Anolis carolinensis]
MGTYSWAWFLLSAFFFHLANQTVFLSKNDANKVIARSKRGYSMFLEEIFEGNLERECLEERCSYEEAREAFEDIENTDRFWKGYFGGVRCSSSPCLHNSVCKDSIRSYTCDCTDGFEGMNCAFAKNECRHEMDEGCQHFCYPEVNSIRCSCAEGYKLGQDKKSCIPLDKCACGRLEDYILTQLNATEKNHGGFPWQVLLLNAEGKWFCGGVLLKTNFVLTTAECALLSPVTVVVGINKLQRARQVISVKQTNTHIRYESNTGENNLALLELSRHINCGSYHLPICVPEKDFAEHVLISRLAATLSGWKVLENQTTDPFAEQSVSYLNENECKGILNRSLITREYCGYSNEGADELLAGGSFSAIDYKGTWFLTGILEPWATEASKWETLIFTKTTRYRMWFKRIMD